MTNDFSSNTLLKLCYDGAPFDGWQDNHTNQSIEGHLSTALARVLGVRPKLQAASRTDKGVHALDQAVNFHLPKPFPLERLPFALNRYLPAEIRVLHATAVSPTFHPSLHAKEKHYCYYTCLGPTQLPWFAPTSWHVPHQLDLGAMRRASLCLIGKHDFRSFCNLHQNQVVDDATCHLHSIEIESLHANRLCFHIRGNRFLYKMVRTLVGTLVDVGRHRTSFEEIPKILSQRDRKTAGQAAPAHGLFLANIQWLDTSYRAGDS